MAYTKQPLRPRVCTHCGDPYQAVDKRRLYCSPSCKTLASNARRRAAPPPVATTPETTDLAAPATTAAAESVPSLPFDAQTVGVVAVGSALGTLGLRAVEQLLSKPASSAPPLPATTGAGEREDPAAWFPAAVLTTPAATHLLHHPQWPAAKPCLQLDYFGRRFYYQPALRCLFWECAPGRVWPLNLRAEFTRVFELEMPALSNGSPAGHLHLIG